jgi:4-amino-4-deoxy-L-arabinose transferase-like glycosyltransferase
MIKDVIKSVKKLKNFKYILFLVLILSFFLRFWGLGYSNFYGDETKTFYLDKTVSAHKFFLDQRKGPVQFGVVWGMEKVLGGYDQFYTRIPFALAGILSVLILFLIVQNITGNKAALIATTLFGLNGFYIAFSRTIQYQSFMILFGLLSIYFILLYQETKSNTRLHYLVLSGFFLALSYLSHYDAFFFDIAVLFVLIKVLVDNKGKLLEKVKEIVIYFLIPFLLLVGVFYLPYVISGYYKTNTVEYVGRRLIGSNFDKNISWYTFWAYNPHSIWAFLSVFLIPFLLKRNNWDRNLLLFWFLSGFIVFEFIITNPGTHIHNYFIPLIIIISVGIADFMSELEKKISKQYFYAFLILIFGIIFIVDLYTYIPGINNGYPWNDSKRGNMVVSAINKDFHLFLYGFPYNKNWDRIAEYIDSNKKIKEIYTNDNDTIAKYYIKNVTYKYPGPNFIPEYFLYVYGNQEFTDIPRNLKLQLDNKNLEDVYSIEKEFYVDGELSSILYKRSVEIF